MQLWQWIAQQKKSKMWYCWNYYLHLAFLVVLWTRDMISWNFKRQKEFSEVEDGDRNDNECWRSMKPSEVQARIEVIEGDRIIPWHCVLSKCTKYYVILSKWSESKCFREVIEKWLWFLDVVFFLNMCRWYGRYHAVTGPLKWTFFRPLYLRFLRYSWLLLTLSVIDYERD